MYVPVASSNTGLGFMGDLGYCASCGAAVGHGGAGETVLQRKRVATVRAGMHAVVCAVQCRFNNRLCTDLLNVVDLSAHPGDCLWT